MFWFHNFELLIFGIQMFTQIKRFFYRPPYGSHTTNYHISYDNIDM